GQQPGGEKKDKGRQPGDERKDEGRPPEVESGKNGRSGGIDWAFLKKELEAVNGITSHGLKLEDVVVCVSELVSKTATIDVPFMNSYYVQDLNTLIAQMQDIGKPMKVYLSKEPPMREDLLNHRALLHHLHPMHQRPGRWPARPEFGLYSAQQAALHLVMREPALMGINGPPGTGKSTLLREIIADVVVTRARRLLKYGVWGMFAGRRTVVVDMLGYYPINEDIFGNDGIVVSSNNNAAVENISRELPVLNSIDMETFAGAAYFPEVATNIHGAPCWGLLSAVLGKSNNRNSFITKFWFSREHGFGKFLKSQYEDAAQAAENMVRYKKTAAELTALLEEYEKFRSLASDYHEQLLRILPDGGVDQQELEKLGGPLQTEWEISSANLPGGEFLNMPLARIHSSTPYSSVKINTLRSRIFLLSLELHHWAIRVNARQFNSNLNAFVNMVSNKQADVIDEKVSAVLWNSFFFCIPVVSVTLASFRRQFPKIKREGIGWLLLDEAGQATPGSTCGAIWRSKRCILIGDTLQIPPIVTIPAGLARLLQKSYGIDDDFWNPVYHSAQSLADRVTPVGTYIDVNADEPIWTGVPLRAHRRCGEPMFSLSNAIAYNGQMVKVTPNLDAHIPTGGSAWIDVVGHTVLDRHAIEEELAELGDYLQLLRPYDKKIYVISPFVSVADACGERFGRGRVSCGTIHTFQGKEAEVVFLVLGTSPGAAHARDWVAQSPNMLNVAITRARERLYVIGNRGIWSKHRYFDHLAEKLPVRKSGRLFG
ncbi:MAG TPA: AAA domain-containing protein, partial [Puia sp.]